jgi:hypothetical protein
MKRYKNPRLLRGFFFGTNLAFLPNMLSKFNSKII